MSGEIGHVSDTAFWVIFRGSNKRRAPGGKDIGRRPPLFSPLLFLALPGSARFEAKMARMLGYTLLERRP
jgi:hypothetical protein